ncbi:MAG TPA: hypothetical protein VFS40_14525 [Gemmatimonadales bacterium]|nr:hypothetical protein [Gemmatimonadales bacterium]
MLSASEVAQERRRRPPASLKQQYQEYVMQRIENFKNSMSRDELLRLGDEAVQEMHAAEDEQFVLTEIMMLESVDRLIMRRLSLRSYRRWRQQFLKLRAAQREPTRWGLDSSTPLLPILPRLEPEDYVVVLGGGAEAACYLLAAHDASVTFLGGDMPSVDRVESRMADESLPLRDAFVVQLGHWLPPFEAPADLLVLDVGALAELEPARQRGLVTELQARTAPGGVHVLLAGTPGLAPEALLCHYDGWERGDRMLAGGRRRGDARRSPGLIVTRPPEPGAQLAAL